MAKRTVLKDTPQTIREMIILLMWNNKLTQKEMANKLNLKEARISEIVRNKGKITLEIAKKLHEEFKISAEWLLTH